ncbi:hypothetical protein AVEN_202509-1 [Araneus ventricosus]|uniref:Uncharacterized protein n=1 Tax=Araneus ventricosus TaxID=182803 RepID=A0A4Y2M1Y4_ARAVE|nr:hypothetical protein AVEN_202509-1 [Araneus ventricosus]
MNLSNRYEKKPRHQTGRWRSLWKRDIPLYLGIEGKGIISFGSVRTGGSFISLCTPAENEDLAERSALILPNVVFDFVPVSFLSSTRLLEATLFRAFLVAVGQYSILL